MKKIFIFLFCILLISCGIIGKKEIWLPAIYLQQAIMKSEQTTCWGAEGILFANINNWADKAEELCNKMNSNYYFAGSTKCENKNSSMKLYILCKKK